MESTVTDAEKLDMVRAYAEQMAPVVRIALLFDPETTAEHRGFDKAMRLVQQELLSILDHP